MSDIAIRVENYIQSHRDASRSAAEARSKLYHIGRAQQRHDTLRDALVNALPRIPRISRKDNSNNSSNSWQKGNSSNSSNSWQEKDTDLWALRDVSNVRTFQRSNARTVMSNGSTTRFPPRRATSETTRRSSAISSQSSVTPTARLLMTDD